MAVANTIAKWQFIISTVTLWYGEDEILEQESYIFHMVLRFVLLRQILSQG